MSDVSYQLVTHNCGGTVLVGGTGDQRHYYCDRCHAFTYDLDGAVPSGVDSGANQRAYAGKDESPDAGERLKERPPG